MKKRKKNEKEKTRKKKRRRLCIKVSKASLIAIFRKPACKAGPLLASRNLEIPNIP